MDAERIIDALKNGNVPPEGVGEICVGREREIGEFDKILEKLKDGAAITRFLNGEFGSGKSFFLRLLEERALADNFVVARVTLAVMFPSTSLR